MIIYAYIKLKQERRDILERTATSTIKGFNYQFNKAILEILNAKLDTKIVLEGYIEDIDVFKPDETIAIQCKYYESSENLSISILTRPILDMIVTFINNKSVKYKLYIHYKNAFKEENIPFDLKQLDNILKNQNIKYIKKYFPVIFKIDNEINELCLKNKNTAEEKNKIVEYFTNNTMVPNFNKAEFIQNVEIIAAPSYEELLNKIFSVMESYGHNIEDIKELLYPNIFQKVANLSCEPKIEKRTIDCEKFRSEIFSLKTLLTSKWLKNIYNSEIHKKSLKRHLKIRLQGNSNFRIIIVDAEQYNVSEICGFINDYVKKYNKKPKLNSCPLFIVSCSNEDSCSLIQQSLYENYSLNFEDGDVGKKFNLNKLINSKGFDLKICYNHTELQEYIILHRPDDLFAIGNVNMELYEQNSMEFCKIEELNIQEVKEVFFLGGKYERNR